MSNEGSNREPTALSRMFIRILRMAKPLERTVAKSFTDKVQRGLEEALGLTIQKDIL